MILPESNGFSQLLEFPILGRVTKPRSSGCTMVIDKGLGYNELEDLLEVGGAYTDFLKFGFGTACLYPGNVLRSKLTLCKLHGIHPCTGGTLAEVAIWQDRFELFVDRAVSLGFSAIEVSDGTITLDPVKRRNAIQTAAAHAIVISEVGKKLSGLLPQPRAAAEQILADLEAGASLVIVEGRESGENVGIYGAGGKVAEDVLEAIVNYLPVHAVSRVMWEAPKKEQQLALLKRFGSNVNLGNISPAEVMALESLRTGLRSDTFAWVL